MGLASSTGAPAELKFETFKEFLASPPAATEAVFVRHLSYRPIAFPDVKAAKKFIQKIKKTGWTNSTMTELYHMKYQRDPLAHFLRRLNSTNELTSTTAPRLYPFHGNYGTNWWWLKTGDATLMYYDLNSPLSDDNICSENIRWSTELLRFAMFMIDESSVRWDDTHPGRFRAVSEQDRPVEGEVRLSPQGTVRSVSYVIAGGESKNILFSYERELPLGFPSRLTIERKAPDDDTFRFYASFDVMQISFSPEPMPREAFSPNEFIVAKDLTTEITMDGRAFILTGTNRVEIPTQSPAFGKDVRFWLPHLLFWGVCGVIVLSVGKAIFGRSGKAARSI